MFVLKLVQMQLVNLRIIFIMYTKVNNVAAHALNFFQVLVIKKDIFTKMMVMMLKGR